MTALDTATFETAIEPVTAAPALDIVIPVHNEQHDLEPSVRRLHSYLTTAVPVTWQITVVDNASTDQTWPVACRLSHELPGVRVMRLAQKGRGRALRHAWGNSEAAVLVYMDVDLSTELSGLLPLVAPLLSGHSDVAIGSRLAHGARVRRGTKRELISRCYNVLLHTTLHTKVSDAQCGFKAIRRDRAMQLLPLVKDQEWFFDTELLVNAERAGLRIHEVPVDWIDDPDSRADIIPTAIADLRGILRLVRARRSALHDEILRFVAVGALSTIAYLLLYLGLRRLADPFVSNAAALLTTAVLNTAANREWTFGVTERDGHWRHQAQGLVVFAVALIISTCSLAALRAVDPGVSRGVELVVLVVANFVATVVRFLALRHWVFRRGFTGRSQGSYRMASEP